MSMFRKTVLTTAIIGAGLASTTGAAFASECHDSGDHHDKGSHSKTVNNTDNSVKDSCISGSGSGHKSANGELAVANLIDAPISSNICNVANNNLNGNFSGNSIDLGLGTLPIG